MAIYCDASFEPDSSIGYLVRRAHLLGNTLLEPVFAAEGMTMTQWLALVAIWFGRGDTAADLARDLGHDAGAMARLVDQIEQNGWIERTRADTDRRRLILKLTDAGEQAALRCKARVVDCWNRWLANWSPQEAETLIVLLRKLRDTLACQGAAA